MTADPYSWPLSHDDYARRIHTAEATVTRLRAEVVALEAEVDVMRHDLMVACAHDGKRDGRIGVPIVAAIVAGLPIPWEHVQQEVHHCENPDPEHQLQAHPKGCVRVASWAPDKHTESEARDP